MAPAWHTVVLIVGILALSVCWAFTGIAGCMVSHGTNRIHTYATTAVLELVMLGWVAFGLRLKGISAPIALWAAVSSDFRSIALDAGIAFLFWIGSLMVLGNARSFSGSSIDDHRAQAL